MQPEYVVVLNTDIQKFVQSVNGMLMNGFALVGGMSACEADVIVEGEPSVRVVHYQAMIRMPRVAGAPMGLQIPKGVG